MDVFDIADEVIAVAEKVLPLVVPGGETSIAAAKAILDLGKKIKPALLEQDAAKLTTSLDELASRVMAHAAQTSANLRK